MTYLKLDSFVNDFTNTLSKSTLDEYNEKFFNYEKNSDVQIATIFIKHRNGRELRDIALEIFNENGIGYKQTNSGLLLIVVTDEKKIRIMTGKGMEIEFPDSLARDIIQGELRDLLNKSDYEQLLKSWYELATKSRGVNKIKKVYSGGNDIKKIDSKYGVISFLSFFGGIVLTIVTSSALFAILGVGLFFAFIVFGAMLPNSNRKIERYEYIAPSIVFAIILFTTLFFAYGINHAQKNGININSNTNSSWDSSSSSDWDNSSSSDSNSSSSSDWGGGSSNGGGWGD